VSHAQLLRSVAGQTGESLRTVRHLGFQLHAAPLAPESGGIRLVVDCPSCRRPVPYPGKAGDGSPALAECPDPRCDVYFAFDPARVYAARA